MTYVDRLTELSGRGVFVLVASFRGNGFAVVEVSTVPNPDPPLDS
jgi:hypothetical protein